MLLSYIEYSVIKVLYMLNGQIDTVIFNYNAFYVKICIYVYGSSDGSIAHKPSNQIKKCQDQSLLSFFVQACFRYNFCQCHELLLLKLGIFN